MPKRTAIFTDKRKEWGDGPWLKPWRANNGERVVLAGDDPDTGMIGVFFEKDVTWPGPYYVWPDELSDYRDEGE